MSSSLHLQATSEGPTKRRRTRGACDYCKVKKTRCNSATMPNNVCSNCITYNEACTHEMASKKPQKTSFNFVNYSTPDTGNETLRKERSLGLDLDIQISTILDSPSEMPTAVPALQRLVTDLARRVRNLQARLDAYNTQACSVLEPASEATASMTSATTSPEPSDQQENLSIIRDDKTDIGPELDGLKQLTIGQLPNRHLGKSSSLMLVKSAMDLKQLSSNHSAAVAGTRRAEFWGDQPWQMEQFDAAADLPYIFPDQDLLRHLIDVYFEEESTIAPLLYRPTFEARLSCHLHEYDRSFGALVLAVAAIASRYCNDDPRVLLDPTAKTSAGWHWYRQIRPIPSAFSSPPNLHNVQTYVLCSFYASATNAPPEYTWALPAFGIRMAQAVGAHRAKLGTQPSPEQEEWKRAFWALYCVDIFIAVATGRPMAMGVDDFDVQPPLGVDEAYWELPDPRLVFVQPDGVPSSNACWTHICSILDIMGFAHQTIYAPRRSRLSKELSVPDWDKRTIGAIDNALNEWVDAIPDHLRWNPHNPNELFLRQSVSLYTTFYFVNIIVHRPFIASRVGTSPVSINWPSLAICVNAARACCHVVDMYHRRGFPPMFSVQIMVFYAATVLIMNVWRNKALGNDEQVNKDLQDVHICMGALRISEKRWQNSGRLVDLITAMLSDLENVPTQSPTHPNTQKRTFDSAYLDEENWTFDTMPPTLDGPGFDDLFGPLPIHTADLERPLAADMPEERDADYTSWFAQRFASDFVRADWSSDEAFAMGSETRYYAENNERLRTMDDTRLEDQWIGVEIDPRDG